MYDYLVNYTLVKNGQVVDHRVDVVGLEEFYDIDFREHYIRDYLESSCCYDYNYDEIIIDKVEDLIDRSVDVENIMECSEEWF